MKSVFIFILILGFTFFLGKWLSTEHLSDSSESAINISLCDPTKNTCEFSYKKDKFELEFQGVPSGLVPFNVLVKPKAVQPDSIELSFDMEGMDMGYNKHNLKKKDSDWNANVILPVCSLSRNDWIVNVKLVIDGESHITGFRFSQSE